jgi:hypothetical protein
VALRGRPAVGSVVGKWVGRRELVVEDLNEEETLMLQEARSRNYLQNYQTSSRVDLAWMDLCKSEGRPCITVSQSWLKSQVEVELSMPPGQRISYLGDDEIHVLLRGFLHKRHEHMSWSHHDFSFGPVRAKRIEILVPQLLELIAKDQSDARKRELELTYPGPVEGMATCTNNECMEQVLEVGAVYYIREIPNMRGHCVILRDGQLPMVGYHLDRFELEF